MKNPFTVLDFVTNPITSKVHIITDIPNNNGDVEIDGIKSMRPHYNNFRHSTKEEVIQYINERYVEISETQK